MTPQPTGRLRGNDLVLSRQFRASIEDVWTSITEPSSTARWFGRWEGKPGVGNEIRVQMGFEDGQPWLTKLIEVCEPPRRLVLTSVGSSMTSRLELGLKAIGDGCELEFVHRDIDRAKVGDVGPGWEYYLDCLVASRGDGPRPAFDTYYPAQKAYFSSLTPAVMAAIILVGIAGVLVLFAAVVATRPSAYRVERGLEVAAPTELVFGVADDLHQFAGVLVLFGSPLDKRDPDMQKTFDGPAAGVGQSYAWSGNRDVGKGKLTIEESVPGQKVAVKLELLAPMKSTATCALTFADTPTGSFVTWSMHGNHNFIGKAFGVFMNMDNMLGADIEKGLAQLKAVAEGKHVA